ncbi:MAG TPA: efflux RND transporter periplasmic adaptor subunit, partial [Rhodanobacter sp.]
MTVSQAELLKELRIEKHQRDDHRQGPPRWPWIALALVLLLALAGAGAWWAAGRRAIAVQTA